ncbi:hypothetical protein FOCC_FOCC006834 [Frankliniella occidentalis]|nr:hypothetical protein FOCC_FOCC006834 [Frankliniella occidentalis]
MLVKWNEPYQKLASCDASGIIFVWIKYEGRWSVELINDRNTPVTNFAWSHDGRMALICYRDGFVLVGSVAGQRYWSSMLNLPCTITCGVWTPDDQQVYFGTSSGQLIVMDVNGAMVSQVTVGGGRGITAMAWSCEKFKMDEGDDGDRSSMMHLGPVLSSTIEDDDTSPARSRRPSPSRPATPAPVHQPQVQPQPRSQPQPRARPARHQADDDIRVLAEPLFVNLPAEKDKASPESPPDDTDVESSDSSSPFAPLVAAEVPVKPKKKRTLFDSLNARDVMTLVDWPRRRMRRNKRKDDTEAILLDQDSDADSRHSTPASPSRQPHSTPASPAASKKTPKRTLSSSPIRQRILNSPLLRRRRRNRSEADGESGDEAGLVAAIGAQQYSTLESFQKAQLRQKLKQKKKNKGKECSEDSDDSSQPRQLQFIMHNKAPMWNENSQVYQLDFGGRVTQESAKNFQIEFLNKQVMQFGRIDANAYTLDFQYPFSALQAFAVALANITQRLK